MPTVDNLDIEISASVSKANASLDLLVKRLGKVSASLSGVNTRGIATMASGVNKLANAMNNFSNNTNTAVFTRLTRNLNSLGNIDQNAIANASKSLGKIAGAMKVFNNIDITDNARKLGELAKGISQLGYSSATKAIDNIPKLATAMRNLMQTLSTAPKVSQNIIDMTNALAKLARTGASSGRAANSLSKSLNGFSKSTIGAKRSSLSLAGAIGKVYATYWLLFRAFGKIGEAINISSDLTEVENVINQTFGAYKHLISEFAENSLENYGLSELTAKRIAGRFQAMGTAMGFTQGEMAKMSIALTKLTGDMASFYNTEQEVIARSLQAVFTGEAEPLRKYGLDLTQSTLKQYALNEGIDASVESMSQAEKTMLRYLYVMEKTGVVQGDFARTFESWHNQTVILQGNLQNLMKVVGNIGIHFLKPLVSAFNTALKHIINFAVEVQNALGKIFGWTVKYTPGGFAEDYENASGYADDLASGTGKAAENAKKLKQQLQGIDELNVLNSPSDAGGNGSGGSGGTSATTPDISSGIWDIKETEALYKSELDTLYKLGDYIGTTLKNAMNSIDWNSVYQSAKNFGSGFASFLNGLISPELFGATGRTIAGALNTAIYTALSFGEEFDFSDFGLSVITGINEFFATFDFGALARTINVWVHGLEDALITAIANFDAKKVLAGLTEFLTELDLDVIMLAIGAVAWKYKGSEMTLNALGDLLSSEMATGIGERTVSKGVSLGLAITTAIVGFKLGNYAYDHFPTVQECSDALVELVAGLFDKSYNLSDYMQGAILMSLDVAVSLMNLVLPDGSKKKASEVYKNWLPAYIAKFFLGDDVDKQNVINYFANFTASLKGNAEAKVNSLKKAWNNLKKGSKTLKFVTKISDNVKSKLDKIASIWRDLRLNKSLTISARFNDNFTSAIKNAWNKIANVLNAGLNKINEWLPSNLKFSGRIPTFATGGFPEDGWFRASQGEMMGKFDNGQSVVANNMQITEGISNAVQRGNQQLVAYLQQEVNELRQQNEYLRTIASKEFGITEKQIGQASQRFARDYSNRTGKPAFI